MENFERLFHICRQAAISGERDGQLCMDHGDIALMVESYQRSLELTLNINCITAESGRKIDE